jgi:hypothetical protein
MEILIPKKNVIMDATLLTALMNCGRFYDLNFNYRFQPMTGKSNSLECGSIVHKYEEVYYKSIIMGMKKDDAHGYGMAAAQLYITGCQYCTDFVPNSEATRPECGHPPNEYPGVINTQQVAVKPYEVGWEWVLKTCEQYHEFYRQDHWVPLEIEVVKSKVLYEDDEIRVLWKAKLDAVFDTNQSILPVDHKTMKQNRSTLNLNNQFIGQCLVQGTRQMVENKIGFQKTLEPKDKFIRSMVSFSADRLLEWQGEILPYYAKLLIMYKEMGHFPPNYSNCSGKFGICKYAEVCQADRGMREEVLQKFFHIGPEWNPANLEDND